MEQQDIRQDELQSKVKEQRDKNEILVSESEMHFNIILRFSQGTQSQAGHFVSSKAMEKETVQQTAMGNMEVPSNQGHAEKEQSMDEGHSDHLFS